MNARPAIWIAGAVLLAAAAVSLALLMERLPDGPGAAPPLPELDRLEPPLALRLREVAAEVEAHPDSAQAWGRLGAVLDVHDLDALAVECYERASARAPGEFLWTYSLGVCMWMNDRDGAMARFREAARLRPDHAPVHVYLGIGLLDGGSVEAAESAFRRALAIDSTLTRAHLGLAQVALDRSDAAGAMDALQAVLSLGADSGEVHWLLSEAHRRLGDDDAAARHAALAQRRPGLEPLPDPVRHELSWREGVTVHWRRVRSDAYRREGRLDRVLAEWQEAARLDPDSAEVQFQLGLAHAEHQRFDEAAAHYRRAVSIEPDHAEAHQNLGTALAAQGRATDAIEAFTTALDADPDLHEARYNLGGLLLSQGRTGEGLDQLRRAGDAMADRADVQFTIAMTMRSMGYAGDALVAFERVLAAEPDHARARFEYGVILATQGRLREAAEAFELVVQVAPDRVNVHANLVRALAETGQHGRAIAACRRALAHFPDEARLRQSLAWMLATSADPALRDGTEAMALARALCEQSGYRDVAHLDTLAAASAAAGDFEAAVRHAEAALALVESDPQGDAATTAALRDRLERYTRHEPYTDGS